MFLNFLRGEPEVDNGSRGGLAFICRSQDFLPSSYSFSCGWPPLALPQTVHHSDCSTIICWLDVCGSPQPRPLVCPLQSSPWHLRQPQSRPQPLTTSPYVSASSSDWRGASSRRSRLGWWLPPACSPPAVRESRHWPLTSDLLPPWPPRS